MIRHAYWYINIECQHMDVLQKEKQATISYSDEDLLVVISFREKNEVEAKEAFKIFYDRYKRFLLSLCYKVCQNIEPNGAELAKDVFVNTMMAVYESSNTYNASKSKVATWLSCIAKHEMLDLLNILNEKRIGEKQFIPLNEDLAISDTEDNIEIETPQKKALDEALQTLSDKERDILLTYMMYQEGNKHLPDEVIQVLCDRYETSSINLRKIKQRALEKVRSHIIQHSHLLK